MSVLKGGWCLTERGNCALARLYRTNTRTSVNAGKGQVSPPGLIIAQAKSGAGLAKQERRVGGSSFAQYELQGGSCWAEEVCSTWEAPHAGPKQTKAYWVC